MLHKRQKSSGGVGDPSDGPALPKRPKIIDPADELQDLVFSDYEGDSSLENVLETDSKPLFSQPATVPAASPPQSRTISPIIIPQTNPTPWTLTVTQIPAGTKKIYVVKRGHQAGFYYDWPSCDARVTGFRDNLYMSFPQGKKASINAINKEQIVRDALTYMNHDSTSCSYKCGGKCRKEPTVVAPAPAVLQPCGEQVVPQKMDHEVCGKCCAKPSIELMGLCAECDTSEKAAILDGCIAEYSLNSEQTEVLENVASGRNVFFTGAAGTGKSRVIQAIVAYLKGIRRNAHVVAPTGMAALNVYGTTLHMYAGWDIKLGEGKLDDLIRIAHETKVWQRIADTHVLIIDEVSMLSGDTFKRLSFQMSEALARPCDPFGGIQLVVTGDFFQLPPILPFKFCLHCGEDLLDSEDGSQTKICAEHGQFHDENKWPFRSNLWAACDFASIQLTEVHRQTDPVFTHLLHEVRKGRWTDEFEALLLDHPVDIEFDSAVKLTPLKSEAEGMNGYHMQVLPYPPRKYHCIDNLTWYRAHPEFLMKVGGMSAEPLKTLDRHKYSEHLELKEGMQVILTHNLDIDAGLVNGSTGKIVRFEEMSDRTLPRAQRNPNDTSTHGEPLITHKYRRYVEERIRAFRNRNPQGHWPVVRFNQNGEERIIYAHCSITELGKEKPFSLLSRTQIPLIAGWAITIHKSQGMTLDSVVVTLDRVFEAGQAYVALSRARSLRTMIVQTLPSRNKLMPDETVQEFMKKTFG